MLIVALEIVIAAAAITGLLLIIHMLNGELSCQPQEGEIYVVVPVRGEDESTEQRLRCAASIARRYGGIRVLAVDVNADNEAKQMCDCAARDNEFVSICGRDELADMLNG